MGMTTHELKEHSLLLLLRKLKMRTPIKADLCTLFKAMQNTSTFPILEFHPKLRKIPKDWPQSAKLVDAKDYITAS